MKYSIILLFLLSTASHASKITYEILGDFSNMHGEDLGYFEGTLSIDSNGVYTDYDLHTSGGDGFIFTPYTYGDGSKIDSGSDGNVLIVNEYEPFIDFVSNLNLYFFDSLQNREIGFSTNIGSWGEEQTSMYNPGSNIRYVSGGSATVIASTVPVPAAIWLFGSGLLGLTGLARRKKA